MAEFPFGFRLDVYTVYPRVYSVHKNRQGQRGRNRVPPCSVPGPVRVQGEGSPRGSFCASWFRSDIVPAMKRLAVVGLYLLGCQRMPTSDPVPLAELDAGPQIPAGGARIEASLVPAAP